MCYSSYFGAFDLLIKQGADFVQIDKVMENLVYNGSRLLDGRCGIDTGVHGAEVMAEGFPDRMKPDYKVSGQILFEANRLGQKMALVSANTKRIKRQAS